MSRYQGLPTDLEGFASLAELALDMRWSWNHATDEVWRQLDANLWAATQNPWVVLQTVSREQIEAAWADPPFRQHVETMIELRRRERDEPLWFQHAHPESALTLVAYFSMEFMLSEALPIYSGGLGNVAGDQLKATSDLGVPVVGIGLLWQQGYFRQVIGQDGSQQALYPYSDPGQLPITPLRHANGQWLRLSVALPGYDVWLRAWVVEVGRGRLYLLDSNDLANLPAHRAITSELYGGGPELRLQQEIVLGIGGWRLLEALGLEPEVCHLNEGHAALAVLERARSFMRKHSQPFDVALAATRAGNLFTTHTAVAAGFDRFEPELVERYLGHYATDGLGIAAQDLLALGRHAPSDRSEPFNMAYLAVRGSGSVNAVSRLHGEVSRRIFEPLFPRWPQHEIPIGHVTNGVHMPTWDSEPADALWTEACGKGRWLGTADSLGPGIRGVDDARLWRLRSDAREALVTFVRTQLSTQLRAAGSSAEAVEQAAHVFDPKALTLGFARRFATYKRPDLLLHDAERLLRLLANREHPVQLVIAGKAHPEDDAGQALIAHWIHFIKRPEARPHVVFLSDYDMRLAEQLVQGVDVWINTPRRPWEASGTSGMKVLVNGGINLSELDGWWAEAYAPEVGWALGDGREHGDDPAWDAAEAQTLYELLEREVVPEFYARGENGIPARWVARMRESMARLTPRFSTSRAIGEYTEQHYLPAAAAYRARAESQGARGKQVVLWQRALDRAWNDLRFDALAVETDGGNHTFEIAVHLAGLEPADVRVQLYAERDGDAPAALQEMRRVPGSAPATDGCVYRICIAATRPASDYTIRVVPYHEGIAIPLEEARVAWLR